MEFKGYYTSPCSAPVSMTERMHARVSEGTMQGMRDAAAQRKLPDPGNTLGVKVPLSVEQIVCAAQLAGIGTDPS